ncbi:hypothetical protein BB559_006550 [Furculomyces boomerangus]|uniref:Uncharacterized protein n=1 Tax=Furculomyces boomerangus TaxID=61424 RepID=A0A2T9Y213_9FUNG|nr:hypothetical protein BB559_006550 [Furculomyces boomerangus]
MTNDMEPQPGSSKRIYWTPGSTLFKPRTDLETAEKRPAAPKLLKKARKLSCVRQDDYSGLVLPTPEDFNTE